MKRIYCGLLIAMLLVPALWGCDGQTAADDAAVAAFTDQIQTFLGDFARQVLAAWLL